MLMKNADDEVVLMVGKKKMKRPASLVGGQIEKQKNSDCAMQICDHFSAS